MAKRRSEAGAASSLDKLTRVLDRLSSTLTGALAGRAFAGNAGAGFSSGVSSVGAPAKMVESAVDKLTKGIDGIVGKLAGAGGSLAKFTDKFNPAIVQQFDFALNDLMAVFGDAFQPVLKAVTGVVRVLADTFERMRPALDPILAVVARMIELFGKLAEPLAQVLVPLLGLFGQLLENLVPIFEKLVDVIREMAKAFVGVINWLIDKINWVIRNTPGIDDNRQLAHLKFDDLPHKSAFGKAYRGANRTDASSLGEQTRQAAFGQSINWEQKTAQNTQKVADLMGDLLKKMDQIAEDGKRTQKAQERLAAAVTTGGK